MRNILAIVFSFVLFSPLFSQDVYSDSLKIILETNYKDAKATQEVAIPLVTIDSTAQKTVDIKANHWDTAVFNPYKNTITNYPMAIAFEDTTYASPIRRPKVITSRYGWRRGRPHQGIDIDLVTGDKVMSVLDGVVRFARYSRGHGKVVVVRHFNGLETAYAHLSKIAVKPNDTLAKGQYLGVGGSSGRSTGSHLHFATMYLGEYIHPQYVFDFSEKNKIRAKELWVTKAWTRASYHNARRQSKLALYTTKDEALASLVKTKKIYVVKRGDTLSRISKRNNVSVASICKTNAITKTSLLKVGQKLVLEL